MEETFTWLFKVNRVAAEKSTISERSWRNCGNSVKDFFIYVLRKTGSLKLLRLTVFVYTFMIFLRILNVTVIKDLDLKILEVKVCSFWDFANDRSIINSFPLYYLSKYLALKTRFKRNFKWHLSLMTALIILMHQ